MPYAGEQISRGGVKKQDEMAEGIDKKTGELEKLKGFKTVIRNRTNENTEDTTISSEQEEDAKLKKEKVKPMTLQDLKDAERRKKLFGEFVPRKK